MSAESRTEQFFPLGACLSVCVHSGGDSGWGPCAGVGWGGEVSKPQFKRCCVYCMIGDGLMGTGTCAVRIYRHTGKRKASIDPSRQFEPFRGLRDRGSMGDHSQ